MKRVVIISFISLILDLILSNFLPYTVNLSLFTTLFCPITIFLVYKLFKDDIKSYYIYSFIFGIIYDLFLTNLFLYDAFIFLLIAFITNYIYKNLTVTYISNIVFIIFIITFYYLVFSIFISIFNLVPNSFNKVFYIITHSIISNIIYGEIIFKIVDILLKDKKRIFN